MMQKLWIAFLISVATGSSFAIDFHVEDPALKQVPKAVASAIRETPVPGECKKFIGMTIGLDGNAAKSDWIVTTANGCGAGNSMAPIWVVRRGGSDYRVVLNAGGMSVTLGNGKQNNLRHIATAGGNASHYIEYLFKFDGVLYQKAKERFVDLTNSDDCKKPENKDVCP